MKTNKLSKTLLPILVLLLLLVAQRYLNSSDNTKEAVPVEEGITTSLPVQDISLPVASPRSSDILVEHEGFCLLFDTETMCPRWVAWELTAEETRGTVSREGVDFKEDESVPKEYRVAYYDYNGGHYGRGHMCPAGDMKWSQEAMTDCHYMTNICPQTAELNKNWWEHLERACRQWARQEGSVQIVCGPVFSESPEHIGKRHSVAVPEAFYKVILSLKEGNEKAIGFLYANDDSAQPMEEAVCSVDEIEQLTGIDFFSSLPDEQEDRLEAMHDLRAWDK
ncbi:MAG: DNA/RNA non-specific endonuclease [Bacteroidaceae bacterium]|nr:DNA/RNA non-specific endonuclease [Bacteroidaceae bacterium]